jgi:hypothetical protein
MKRPHPRLFTEVWKTKDFKGFRITRFGSVGKKVVMSGREC